MGVDAVTAAMANTAITQERVKTGTKEGRRGEKKNQRECENTRQWWWIKEDCKGVNFIAYTIRRHKY